MHELPLRSAVLAAVVLLFSSPAAAELVMTAPTQLTAGRAATLVFRAEALGYDTTPATAPAATVQGDSIRIDINAECAAIYCDAIAPSLFRVELPPLDQGSYTVQLFDGPDAAEPDGQFTLDVGAASAVEAVAPSDGFWTDLDATGTGMHFQRRGPLLAVSQFDFSSTGRAHWRLDVAPLHGDAALVLLRDYYGGSCFGCDPFEPPFAEAAALGGTVVRLTFQSDRQALAELEDGTEVPLGSLPFGAGYEPVALEEEPTGSGFPPLVLPDLQGTWGFGDPLRRVVAFERVALSGGPEIAHVVRYEQVAAEGAAPVVLECRRGEDGAATGCTLEVPGEPATWFAPLGNVGEERIRFDAADGATPLVAARIPEGGNETELSVRPAEGFWFDPSRPGTGLHLQQRGSTLAVSQFDFLEGGDPVWRLAAEQLAGHSVPALLINYLDGSCFGCTPHVAPTVDSTAEEVVLTFQSARRAYAVATGRGPVRLVNMAFGAEYVDAALADPADADFAKLPLPDLQGTWAFGGPNPTVRTFGPAELRGATVVFPVLLEEAGGELRCSPGTDVSPAGCELVPGIVITPPPGFYPFARIGDIEEGRMRLRYLVGAELPWKVVYAVRLH